MNFKPTKWKVIGTIVLGVLAYLAIVFIVLSQCPLSGPDCDPSLYQEPCEEVFHFRLFWWGDDACMGCNRCPDETSPAKLILDVATFLAIFAIIYIIWSLLQNRKKVVKR